MSFIRIRFSPIEVEIRAHRRLVFEAITAFGAAAPGAGPSSRILSRDDGRLLVEFKTSVPLFFRMRKVFRTVERVILQEPEQVEFEEVEGPLAMRRERIVLDEEDGGTRVRYEAELGVGGWALGWLLGVLFVRPKMTRAVREHLQEIKESIEAQATKS
jgi:hypothetical protein